MNAVLVLYTPTPHTHKNNTKLKYLKKTINFSCINADVWVIMSYRSNLDGLWQGQLSNGCGCRSRDIGPIGAVLLAGWMHGCSKDLSLGLLDQQLLLWGQGQLKNQETKKNRQTKEQSQEIRERGRIEKKNEKSVYYMQCRVIIESIVEFLHQNSWKVTIPLYDCKNMSCIKDVTHFNFNWCQHFYVYSQIIFPSCMNTTFADNSEVGSPLNIKTSPSIQSKY